MNREEAIKVLNARPYTGEVREALETLIPELKESEDEKMVRIIENVICTNEGVVIAQGYGLKLTDLADWLEKQKKLFESGKGLYYYDGEKTTYCGYPATEENPYDFAISQQEKQKEHQNNSDAHNESSWAGMISSSDKDKNLDEIAQDYIDGVKEYNPEPTWDLMQTAVCYGYHLAEKKPVLFIPKFRVGDMLISTKNSKLTYKILEVGHINELGNPEYKVEIFEDGKPGIMNKPHNIHYMECHKVDEWGELIEQKPKLYWHKIKAYEQLPCKAYIYKFAYEQENNFHGKATIKGYLVPNDPVKIGCDTWYLPVEDIKNLPKEDELNTTSLMKTVEQQSAEWSEEDEKQIAQIERIVKNAGCTVTLQERIHNWLKSLCPQQKVEWSEEDRINLNSILSHLEEYLTNDAYTYYKRWLESLCPQPKQEWSEEDEVYLQDALWCVKQASKVARGENDMGACWSAERWLKYLPERLNLQPNCPQNKIHYWTEEEIEPIISDYLTGREHYGGMMSRLRCLKPKSHWKPSEEQMGALERSVEYLEESDNEDADILAGLYEQLKKLM